MKYLVSIFLLVASAAALSAQDAPTPDPLIAAVKEATEPTVLQSLESNDRSYTASVTAYPCVDIDGQEMAYERLDITIASTGETQMVDEQLLYCGGLGAFGLLPIQWSENGEFLYYTDAREGVPDGLSIGWVPPLYRVSLPDLQIEPLGSARFSFNRQELVAWSGTDITVLATNEATRTVYPAQPENLTFIDVMWLPDATGILYIQADALMGGTRSTMTHIDLETGEQTVLLDTAE